jgi:hypothetical protein
VARPSPTLRRRYQIRRPHRGSGLLARLRQRLRRDEHKLLASWPAEAEGSGRREFRPPLRSPLQVWRLEGRRSRLLGAVGSGFLVLGVSVHERGAEFTTLRLGRISLETSRDAVRQEVDHRAA